MLFVLSLFSLSVSAFIYLLLVHFCSVIRHAMWKIKILPLGGFFHDEKCARQIVTIAFLLIVCFILQIDFFSMMVTLPAATMPSFCTLTWCSKDRIHSPTHHFLKRKGRAKTKKHRAGPLPHVSYPWLCHPQPSPVWAFSFLEDQESQKEAELA